LRYRRLGTAPRAKINDFSPFFLNFSTNLMKKKSTLNPTPGVVSFDFSLSLVANTQLGARQARSSRAAAHHRGRTTDCVSNTFSPTFFEIGHLKDLKLDIECPISDRKCQMSDLIQRKKNEKIGILAIRIASSPTPIARGWNRGFRQILWPNTFKNQKSALRSGILFATSEVMHRPRSDCPLHFDISNIWQIRTAK